MCNLYRIANSSDEVARWFRVRAEAGNVPEEIYPGLPGLVMAGGALRSMIWGFPLALTGQHGQPLKPKPVNNTRADKLASPFWRASFERRRCLVPMTGFAEAEGRPGSKTCTWLSVPGQPFFACAGIWRDSDEWGPVYSIVLTDAAPAMVPVHDRMPVILHPESYGQWLEGPPEAARALCGPWNGELAIERTAALWSQR